MAKNISVYSKPSSDKTIDLNNDFFKSNKSVQPCLVHWCLPTEICASILVLNEPVLSGFILSDD
jgi:hypothetical protein